MPRGRGASRPAPFFDTLEPWFAVSFWCDGQEVEREARCCIMPIEAVAGQSAAGELRQEETSLVLTSKAAPDKLLLEVPVGPNVASFRFSDPPPASRNGSTAISAIIANGHVTDGPLPPPLDLPDASDSEKPHAMGMVTCSLPQSSKGSGAEVVRTPYEMRFPDRVEYGIFKGALQALIAEHVVVPRQVETARRLIDMLQVPAGLPPPPPRPLKRGRKPGQRLSRIVEDDGMADGDSDEDSGIDLRPCVCCGKLQEAEDLVPHPSVPMSGSGARLWVCGACRPGVVHRRHKAHSRQELYDLSDHHEVICAVCSRARVGLTLVMCDDCSFSFCKPCLEIVIAQDEIDDIEEDDESPWSCPGCRHGVHQLPPDADSDDYRLFKGTHALTWLQRWGPPPPFQLVQERESGSVASQWLGDNGRTDPPLPPLKLLLPNPFKAKSVSSPTSSLLQGDFSDEHARKRRRIDEHVSVPTGPPRRGRPPRKHLPQVDTQAQWGPLEEDDRPPPDPRKYEPPRAQVWDVPLPPSLTLTVEDLRSPTTESTDGSRKLRRGREEGDSAIGTPTRQRGRKKGQGKAKEEVVEVDDDDTEEEVEELPPVHASKDHVDFFAHYVRYITDLPVSNKVTENSCFLCKDGGELLECDCDLKDRVLHCKKVYHEYCLGFEVSTDPKARWICPRHLCMTCAERRSTVYFCRFCPNSACPDHVPPLAFIVKDIPKPRELANPSHVEMVCPDCVRLVIRARFRQELARGECAVIDAVEDHVRNAFNNGRLGFHPVLSAPTAAER